eukprot:4148518-Pyramimonas_sp.AAC.1
MAGGGAPYDTTNRMKKGLKWSRRRQAVCASKPLVAFPMGPQTVSGRARMAQTTESCLRYKGLRWGSVWDHELQELKHEIAWAAACG